MTRVLVRILFASPGKAAAGVLGLALSIAAPGLASDFSVPLVWHVETDNGKVLDSRDPDRSVNPASVVKLATSLRALETLGPDHRFVTTIGAAHDDLVIDGGADPDFHAENAWMVAHALVEQGVTQVRGDLFVGPTFWIGWERGTAGRQTDALKRRDDMGRRLIQAWSPSTWSPEEKRAWSELAARKRWDAARPPAITIRGKVRTDAPPKWRPLVVHRSQPLLVALRRFNVFSNNDIERLDASVGAPAQMSAFFEKRWGDDGARTTFATSSGLNGNRMTPRQVVRLLRELRKSLAASGHSPADMMPVLGCGHSTLYELFPRLRSSGEADGLVGKTGTLNMQDGGVSALAGFLPVGPGVMFFVAAPGAGHQLPKARAAEEDWVRSVLLKAGPVRPLTCPAPVPTSDEHAEIAGPVRVSQR